MTNSHRADPDQVDQSARLNQMDSSNLEYRVQLLEQEMLPKRVQVIELTMAQMQGEVTAIKEIARGIGIKVDSGFEKLSTDSSIRIQDLKMDQVKNYAFVKGILWVGGIIGGLVALGPAIGDIASKLLGH